MFTSEFVVKNPPGLHARPASQLAKLCKDIPDDIRLICEKGTINPKNVIGILTAGLKKGSAIKIEVEGASEQESGAKIMEFLEGLTD